MWAGKANMVEPIEVPSALRALLSADGDGPAERIDEATARRIVERAIEPAQDRPVAFSSRKRAAWLLVAALVLTGSAAAMYAALRSTAPAHPPRAIAKRSPAVVVQPAPVLPVLVPEPAQTPVKVEHSERPASQGKTTVDTRIAEDLLQRANRQRGEGHYRDAEHTYLRVLGQNPSGAAAYAARVAAAGLRLEQLSDTKGALRLYEEALRVSPAGALSPEIHEGMAHAYRTLGRADDERHSLQALLQAQPAGPAAESARQRLLVLDARK
jgi:tetratricopeptide (TPR) repeat protein